MIYKQQLFEEVVLMPEYEIRSDGKLVRKGASASTPSSVAQSSSGVSSHGTSSTATTNSGYSYTPRTTYYSSHNYNSSSNIGTKTFAVLFPILFFIIGQIIQYSVYASTGAVLVMDLIFPILPLPALIVSTVLGVISTIHIAVRSWKLADDNECGCSWTYIIISGLMFAIIPCVAGYLGIIITSAISWLIEEGDEEIIPRFLVWSAFIVGQVIMWAQYAQNSSVLFISDFVNPGTGAIVFSVIMAIIAFIATIIMSIVFEDIDFVPTLVSTIVFCSLLIIAPTATAIPLLICAIVIIKNDYDDSVQIWASVITSVIVIVAFLVIGLTSLARPQYTITFDLQGGVCETTSVEARYKIKMPSAEAPERIGYSFMGYYDSPKDGVQYYTKEMKSARRWDKEQDATLYAHWKANTYTVTLDAQGGSGGSSSVIATYDQSMPSASKPSLSGYYFCGYYTGKNGSGTCYYDSRMRSASDWDIPNNTTLYAAWEKNSSSGGDDGCIATGTKILLPSGNTTNVEDLSVGDKVLTWDFVTQSFVETSVTLLVNHGEKEYEVITLIFEDQTFIQIIDSHVFFDITLGEYVTLDKTNCETYFGHSFMTYQVGDSSYSSKKLINVIIKQEQTCAYAVITETYYSCITDNVITATPTIPGIYQLVSSYLDENLNFDHQQFLEDVNKYGTYDYELFKEYISYEQYIQLCAPYFKLAEIKGFTTFEEIYELMVMYSYVY